MMSLLFSTHLSPRTLDGKLQSVTVCNVGAVNPARHTPIRSREQNFSTETFRLSQSLAKVSLRITHDEGCPSLFAP
jgi:hypothetical protein